MSDDLYLHIRAFRKAIEGYAHSKDCCNRQLASFPTGCCEYASELLQKYLCDVGVFTFLVRASFDNNGQDEFHVWLETDKGIIIDITGDQYRYKSEYLFYSQPVFMGNADEFHNLFSIQTKEPPIDPDYDIRPKGIIDKMKRDYEGILKILFL